MVVQTYHGSGEAGQVNQEFKANLSYIKPNLKKKNQKLLRDLTKARNPKHRK